MIYILGAVINWYFFTNRRGAWRLERIDFNRTGCLWPRVPAANKIYFSASDHCYGISFFLFGRNLLIYIYDWS